MPSPPKFATHARTRLAQSRAVALLEEMAAFSVPVDPAAVAKHIHARIVRKKFPSQERVSGALVRSGSELLIVVNAAHDKKRQRFTIAHEIGHHVLHGLDLHVDKTHYRDDRSGTGEDQEEVEANAFAAELLMPSRLLEKGLKVNRIMFVDEDLIDDLAEEYQVSRQAMTWRLTNLGYLR